MAKRYEITIGETDAIAVAALAKRYVQGATITEGYDLWEGETERSVTVTIYGGEALALIVHKFAQNAAHRFNQDCVLVSVSECTAALVDSEGHSEDL